MSDSGFQVVPALASKVTQLTVFQRTPIWVAPRPDGPLDSGYTKRWGVVRSILRFLSELRIEFLTFGITNYSWCKWPISVVEAALRGSMRRQVRDETTREGLIPKYGLGCKRPATSNTYLKSFNQPNVELVTTPIHSINEQGIRTIDQKLWEV